MKQTIYTIITALAVFLNCTGCALLSSADSPEPAFYDLAAAAAPAVVSPPVVFSSISDLTGNGLRFVERLPDGRVRPDDLNRFSAPLSQLILRRLNELFRTDPAEDSLGVRGTIIRFETDREKGKALMVADYYLSCGTLHRRVRHRITADMKGHSGADRSAALEKCVIRSAQRLGKELCAFKKQCNKEKK